MGSNYKRIILVDDDLDDHEIFSEALKDIKAKIEFAGLNESKRLIDFLLHLPMAHLPQLIFLDINMPSINGLECLAQIRKRHFFKDHPVIMYSTGATKQQILDAYFLGANLYVQKPYNYEDLKSMLEKIMNLKWKNYMPHPDIENFVWGKKGISVSHL